jgi:hypothetical protein
MEPLADRMLDPIQFHTAFAIQYIVNLGANLVVMLSRAIDIDGVSPGHDVQAAILTADEPVPPAASAALARRIRFVPDQGSRRSLRHA